MKDTVDAGNDLQENQLKINTNSILEEITAFPSRYKSLITKLPKSELRFCLRRLKRIVREALTANPPPTREEELRALHTTIENDEGGSIVDRNTSH